MPRLPKPGSDVNTWGDILNEFLTQAHNADGTLKHTGILATKADDDLVVHNSGDETVEGVKNFTVSPTIPTPVSGTEAANKAYVDSAAAGGTPDATTTVKGKIKLAGDLSGTADLPTVAAGAIDNSKVAASLKPSGTAAAGDEALRALGVSSSTAAAGDHTHVASAISFNPAGTIAATDVQAAISEVANEAATNEFPRQPVSAVAQPQDKVATIFPSGHGFTKTGSSTGTLVDDATQFLLGSQSIKITPNADGINTNVRKLSISPTIDFTGKMIKVALRTDNVAQVSGCKLYLSSDNLTSNFGYVELLQGGASYRPIQNNEWVIFTVPWNSLTLTGSPTRSAINAIQVQAVAVSGQIVNIWVNLVAGTPEPANGVVTISFDDGWDTQFTAARPKLDQYGLRPTAYLIADRLGTAGYMTTAQAQELQNYHGWEIGAHAHTQSNHDSPFTNLTAEEIEQDFVQMKGFLWKLGFRAVDHLAYPLGAYDLTKVLPLARKYFLSARTVALYQQESSPPYDPHRLRCYATNNTTTTGQVQAEIDRAIANKTWLILLFHKIPVTATGALDFSVANFNTVIDYLAASAARVKPVGEVIHEGVA